MRKIGKGNLKIIITLMTLILLSTQVAHSETPLYYKELLRIPIGDYRSILERMSTIFYLPFIESKEIERITEEVIERVKTELNIDFTRPEAVVHIKMIVGSGLRRGHSKEHIEKNVKQYPSYIIEVRKNSRNLHQKPSVKNPFKDNETGQGLISESELISILGKEIEKHFGVKLLEKIYIRTKWQEGTLNDHCYDPVFNEMFLDPRNIRLSMGYC